MLGPVRISGGDAPSDVPSDKHRRILALLALRCPAPVNADALIDLVWGDTLPAKPATALQIQISRLRKLLPAGAIETMDSGYRLAIDADDVDAFRFRRLVAAAHASASDGDAIRFLREALALWAGRPLDGDAADCFAADVSELEALRISSLETLYGLELGEGGAVDGEVVAALERLVLEHPYSERLTALLMTALYRSGRQADALRRFDDQRRRLLDDLGISVSEELRELELAMLTHRVPAAQVSAVSGAPPPAPLTNFVGRAEQLSAVGQLAADHRLVTITGPGGVGKTRLVGQLFPQLDAARAERAWFIPLADVELGELVAARAAAVLGLDLSTGVDPLDLLVRRLSDWSCVLILDNCENVLESAALVVHRVLTACPAVTVVATSREPLMLEGERVVPLKGLYVEGAPGGEAESLFLDRAQQVGAGDLDPAAVSRACRVVDGWPLAIELLAANVGRVDLDRTVSEIEERLLDVSTPYRFSTERHSSLSVTLDWSYDLLDDRLQLAYRWLGMFDGRITEEMAARVLPTVASAPVGDDLRRLVDRSLVELASDDPFVVRMLRPVVQHARSSLARDRADLDRAASAYSAAYVQLAQAADDNFDGPDGALWVRRFADEEPNLLRAVEVAVDADRLDIAASLIRRLGYSWLVRDLQPIGLGWIDRCLDTTSGRLDWSQEIDLLGPAGYLAGSIGDQDTARRCLERCLALFEEHDDPERVVALNNLSVVLEQDLDLEGAFALVERARDVLPSYAVTVPHEKAVATASTLAATASSILAGLGRWAEAVREADAALDLAEQTCGEHQIVLTAAGVATVRLGVGDADGAAHALARASAISAELDGYLAGLIAMNEAVVALCRGDLDQAADRIAASLRCAAEHGLLDVTEALTWRGEIERRSGDVDGARSTVTGALRVTVDEGLAKQTFGLCQVAAELLAQLGRSDEAGEIAAALAAITRRTGFVGLPLVAVHGELLVDPPSVGRDDARSIDAIGRLALSHLEDGGASVVTQLF